MLFCVKKIKKTEYSYEVHTLFTEREKNIERNMCMLFVKCVCLSHNENPFSSLSGEQTLGDTTLFLDVPPPFVRTSFLVSLPAILCLNLARLLSSPGGSVVGSLAPTVGLLYSSKILPRL